MQQLKAADSVVHEASVHQSGGLELRGIPERHQISSTRRAYGSARRSQTQQRHSQRRG
jgi:hypothetical protein